MGKKVKKKQRIRKRAGKKKKHKKKPYTEIKGKKLFVISHLYRVENGKVIRLRKFCPVCGPGVFLAEHPDRWSCGRCGYTEWKPAKART